MGKTNVTIIKSVRKNDMEIGLKKSNYAVHWIVI